MVPSSRCHPHAAILKLPSSRCLPQVAVLSLVALPSSRRLLCDAVFFAMPPSRCRPHDAALTMPPSRCALVMPPLRCRPHARDAVRRCRLFVRMPARLRASVSARPHASASACSPARPLLLQLYSCSPDASVSRARKPSAQAELCAQAVRSSMTVATAAAAVIAIDCNG